MRDQVGVKSTVGSAESTLIVVDDGDPGALEATLEKHAKSHELWINLEVPRDPLGHIRLYWQGEYAARQRLHSWCTAKGPIHLRLSSAPDWSPPPIPSLSWLPDFPAVDAVLAVSAPFDWGIPSRTRHGLRSPLHPFVVELWKCREFLNRGEPDAALAKLLPVLKAMPTWPGVWKLAAEAFQARGDMEKAQQSFKRIERLQSVG
jgi:hypothetical protein